MPATGDGSRRESVRALALAALGLAVAGLSWRLRPGTGSQGPVGEIVLGCAWLAWLVAGWLALAVAGCALGRLRRPATPLAVAHRWVPRRLAGLVDLVISVGLVGILLGGGLSPAAATAAAATTVSSVAHPAPGSPLQWPGLPDAGSEVQQRSPQSHLAIPHTRQRAQGQVRLVTAAPRREVGGEDTVTVRRGDSLWSLAAERLGPGASDARIAAEWPRWYAVNHNVIGPDPAVIHPGQQLRPPPHHRRGSSR